jgi:hypothetical protein
MAANNADDPPFASIISTTSFTVVKKIPFDGTNGAPNSNNGAEQCGWSPRTGKFYISIPGIVGQLPDGTAGGVAVIDPKTLSVVTTFLVPPDACEQPQGLAVGPAPQIMLGCNQPSPNGVLNTAIIDENTGAVIATLPNQGGDDMVWFNPSDGHYATAGGQFLPNEQIGIVDSGLITGVLQADQTIFIGNAGGTTRRTHSAAADSNTNLVYVPIPATGGGTPGFTSSICGTSAQQAAGCIAVFGANAPEAPPN